MNLVILPGMDGTGELLAPFVAEIEKRGICVTMVTYPTDQIQSYEELVEQVSLRLPAGGDFAILGESFSGPIALELARRKMPGLRALVLVVTFASPPDSLLLKMTRVLPVNLILSLPIPCWMAKKLMLGKVSPVHEQENFCSVIKEVAPEVIADRLKSVRTLRLAGGKIDLPALYIQGTRDNLLPANSLEGVKQLVPGLVVHRIDGPHLVLGTRPAECAEIVAGFLNSMVIPD